MQNIVPMDSSGHLPDLEFSQGPVKRSNLVCKCRFQNLELVGLSRIVVPISRSDIVNMSSHDRKVFNRRIFYPHDMWFARPDPQDTRNVAGYTMHMMSIFWLWDQRNPDWLQHKAIVWCVNVGELVSYLVEPMPRLKSREISRRASLAQQGSWERNLRNKLGWR